MSTLHVYIINVENEKLVSNVGVHICLSLYLFHFLCAYSSIRSLRFSGRVTSSLLQIACTLPLGTVPQLSVCMQEEHCEWWYQWSDFEMLTVLYQLPEMPF